MRREFFEKERHHWDRIANARSTIDSFSPASSTERSGGSTLRHRKPIQLDEGTMHILENVERVTEIEKENRRLLEKIANIIRSKRKPCPQDAVASFYSNDAQRNHYSSKRTEKLSKDSSLQILKENKRLSQDNKVGLYDIDSDKKLLLRLLSQRSEYGVNKVHIDSKAIIERMVVKLRGKRAKNQRSFLDQKMLSTLNEVTEKDQTLNSDVLALIPDEPLKPTRS